MCIPLSPQLCGHKFAAHTVSPEHNNGERSAQFVPLPAVYLIEHTAYVARRNDSLVFDVSLQYILFLFFLVKLRGSPQYIQD